MSDIVYSPKLENRLALVIGSECSALPPLGFAGELADSLYRGLRDRGGWRPATLRDGPLMDPTVAELVSSVDEAFDAASRMQATLLISFVGHGMATGAADYYLMVRDSPVKPTSRTAFHLVQEIRERMDESALDGIIIMVDACETEDGVIGAAHRWTDKVEVAAQRMELLVATGPGPAYGGCFTRTLISTFDNGLPQSGENLLLSDMRMAIAKSCRRQVPQHLSLAYGGDPGLWLVSNAARRDDAVTGRPAAGLVDQLTRGLVFTDTLREQLAEVAVTGGFRLRAVTGPAGAGKSTLLSILIRPALTDTLDDLSPRYVTAAIFLDIASSLGSVAEELAEQLNRRLTDYQDAAQAVQQELAAKGDVQFNIFEIAVLLPLARMVKPGRRINIVIDGLDQPESGNRSLIMAAISGLTGHEGLAHVRVIVGFREGVGIEAESVIGHAHLIKLRAPSVHEVFEATMNERHNAGPSGPEWIDEFLQAPAGGWLLARLLNELGESSASGLSRLGLADINLADLVQRRVAKALDPLAAGDRSHATAVLDTIVAAGIGAKLPLSLLRAALEHQGVVLSGSRIRDYTVIFGALIGRSSPGVSKELVGIAHQALLDPIMEVLDRIRCDPVQAHRAIVSAIEVAGEELTIEYARGSAARHYLACGRPEAAFAYLQSAASDRAADTRDLWLSWLPAFTEVLGPDHRVTLAVRHNIAFWRSESGETGTAIQEFEALAADQTRCLGGDDRDTFTTRNFLAWWRGMDGAPASAVVEFEQLLADQLPVLGPEDPNTLRTRHNLGFWRGRIGKTAQAVSDLEDLLTDQVRILGPEHPNTLRTRHNLAWWRGMAGYPRAAAIEYQRLLADQLRLLGPSHFRTLIIRGCLALWRGVGGDAAAAVSDLEELLADRTRLLGADHPETLTTRNGLALWRALAFGDAARAVNEFEEILVDRRRVLGLDNPETLNTRRNLAHWRGQSGDAAGAVADLEELLVDDIRVLGPDHPETLRVRRNLAYRRSQDGHLDEALAELEQVLVNETLVLGPENPETLVTRHALANLYGRAGDIAAATSRLEQLIPDQTRVLENDHPNIVIAKRNLAYWRDRRGVDAEDIPETD
ncbi:tetratricopeptide repeat protein [Nocardia sp. NPDC004278]